MRLHTRVCDLLGIDYPIFGAPMGGQAMAELAAAVSEAGGIGMMGLTALTTEDVAAEIRRARELTSKPLGVGLLFPTDMPATAPQFPEGFPDFLQPFWERVRHLPEPVPQPVLTVAHARAQVEVVLGEGIRVLACALGTPTWAVEMAHAAGAKVIAMVGSVRAAKAVDALGVDLIVAQGHEAGGHTGAITTLTLVPQVIDAVRAPVIAAGGIGDGRGVAAALALGAEGVWIGTRLLATPEARTAESHKQRILELGDSGTVVSRCYTGKPSRIIRNAVYDAWQAHQPEILPMPHQRHWMEPIAVRGRTAGLIDIGNFPTGQVAGLVHEIKPAGEVVRELVRDAVHILTDGLAGRVQIAGD